MLRIRDFTPSDDVLNAIRSLRAEDDGMEPLGRDADTSPDTSASESPHPAPKAIGANYDPLSPGRYLRVRV